MASMPGIRTLLVDDAPEILQLLQLTAGDRADLDVVGTATDGAEGIAAAARLQPELVVLDIDMPVLDGISALPGIREAAPHAIVGILSAFDRRHFERLARDSGAVGYVEKGLSPSKILDEIIAAADLLDVVRRVLDETRRRLPRDATSGRAARQMVSETLERWNDREPEDAVELLVTELVTNAIFHGRSEPEVALLLLPGAIRVEVADDSPTMPRLNRAELDAESGRGVALVEELASRWGAEPTQAGGKTVWFEIDRPAPAVG